MQSNQKAKMGQHPAPPRVRVCCLAVRKRDLGRSPDLLNQLARLLHQVLNMPAFRNGFSGMQPILESVFVTPWGTRSRSTAVHATTFFPYHGR
jgi:hypothetical protein